MKRVHNIENSGSDFEDELKLVSEEPFFLAFKPASSLNSLVPGLESYAKSPEDPANASDKPTSTATEGGKVTTTSNAFDLPETDEVKLFHEFFGDAMGNGTGESKDEGLLNDDFMMRELGNFDDNWLMDSPDMIRSAGGISASISPFFRCGKVFDLPLILSGTPLDTFPDTGSELNAISLETLKELKVETPAKWGSPDDDVQMADRSVAGAICQVQLGVKFPATEHAPVDHQDWTFHVFSELAEGVKVIVGQKFLETYRIFTEMSNCLRERVGCIGQIPRCMSVGLSENTTVRMRVHLNDVLVFALADTGSEVNLISGQCARRLGIEICALSVEDNSLVQFANGRLGVVCGKVRVTFSAFEDVNQELKEPGTAVIIEDSNITGVVPAAICDAPYDHTTDEEENVIFDNRISFFVLEELPHDVTLSQELLHSMDAFNRHASAFVKFSGEATIKQFYTIFWYKGKQCQTALTGKYLMSFSIVIQAHSLF